jgi:hypothetical protein
MKKRDSVKRESAVFFFFFHNGNSGVHKSVVRATLS